MGLRKPANGRLRETARRTLRKRSNSYRKTGLLDPPYGWPSPFKRARIAASRSANSRSKPRSVGR